MHELSRDLSYVGQPVVPRVHVCGHRDPVTATFDPVGSTATLVVERFRRFARDPAARRR